LKPWRKSNDKEKLDINNGLLLCPTHDKLIDKGLITFSENGEIIISELLTDDD
ncbi:MAG: HNH endonuclease, partial [Neisseriaceae bacterium]|nr:HNH endonuclease [Neisseriaceae bacterium]MBO7555682.1 HNH endonuclease [Neisseriaceae bacterium]